MEHNRYRSCDSRMPPSGGQVNSRHGFTVRQAMEALGFGRFQIKLSAALAFCWVANAMEFMLIAILSLELACDWNISALQQTLIASFFSGGMFFGCPLLGWVGDTYGRRKALLLGISWTLYFAILSVWSPVYIWIVILRGLSGIGMSSYLQSLVYYMEFLPTAKRGKCLLLLEVWFGVGGIFEAFLGLVVLQNSNWRWWLFASLLPLAVLLPLCWLLPESPTFDIMAGRYDKALTTLKQIARENKKDLPEGHLLEEKQEQRGRFSDLFSSVTQTCMTLLLFLIWFSSDFIYFGLVLLSTEVINAGDICALEEQITADGCQCNRLGTDEYLNLMWTSAAEAPGIIITMFIIDKTGRKNIVIVGQFAVMVLMILLYLCLGKAYAVTLLWLARGVIASYIMSLWLYTPELYQAKVRAVAVGCCSSCGRFGLIVAPFIGQLLLKTSPKLCLATFAALAGISAVASIFLPYDTTGKAI